MYLKLDRNNKFKETTCLSLAAKDLFGTACNTVCLATMGRALSTSTGISCPIDMIVHSLFDQGMPIHKYT